MKSNNKTTRRSLRRNIVPLAVAISSLLISHSVHAASLTWDISLGNGATITGGTGTWTNGLGNWNTGAGDTTWNNATPDAATFGGTAGTVTLGGVVTVGNITLNTANYIIAGGGNTLTLSNSTIFNNPNATISADLGGTTGLIKDGAGVLTLSGTNNYTGATTLTGGTLSVGASNNLGNAASNLVFNGGTLQITGTALTDFSTIGHTVSFTSTKTVGLDINNAAHSFTVDQVLNQTTGGFTKSGAGAAILSQANTYTGTTTVSAGSLSISGSGTLGATTAALTMSGGGFNLGGTSQTVGAVSITTPAASGDTIANGTLTATSYTASNTGTAIISANLNGAAGVNKSSGAGTLKLSGTNAYSGVSTVSAGVLQFANQASLYTGNTANWTKTNITANSGGTLAFNVGGAGEFTTGNVTTLLGNLTTGINNNGLRGGSVIAFDTTNAAGGTFTVGDVIANSTGTGSGTLGLTKLGTNTLVLTNTNTYTGTTNINGGTLQVDGSTAAGSIVSVGTAGTLTGAGTVNGNATMTGSGVINFTNPGVIVGTLTTSGGNWNGAGSVTGKVTGGLTIGSGATLTANGGYDLTGTDALLTGAGTVTANGPSVWNGFRSVQSGSGITNYNGGLTLATGNMTIDGRTINNNAAATLSFSNSAFNMSNGAVFNNTATGTATFTTSFFFLSGNGGTFNNAGVLNANAGTVIFQNAVLNNSGTINLNTGGGMTILNASTSSGTFNIASGASLALRANGPAMTFNAGSTLLGAGTFSLPGNTGVNGQGSGTATFTAPSLANTVNVAIGTTGLAGGTLNLGTGNDFTTTGTLTMAGGASVNGTSTLTAASYALSGGTVNGNLGVGPMTVSGNTALNGTAASSTVDLTAGTLTLGASNRLNDAATVTLTGGTLAIGAFSDTVGAVVLSSGSITGSTGVLTSATTFDVRSGSATAKLGGSVGLTKTTTASVTLSGGSTYTGPTTVSDGTLAAGVVSVANVSGAFGNNSALSIADVATAGVNITGFNTQIGSLTGGGTTGGNVTLGAATLTTGGDNTSPAAYGGIISGTGGLTKIGTGTQTLNGANTFSGTATVSGGVLRLDGATSLTGGTDTTVGVGESRLTLNGGVLGLGAGDFTRALGTGAGQVQITAGGGGFAAYGAPRNVNLGGASAAVTWNTGSFVPTGSNLILSAADATDTVTFQNPINLGAAVRTVQVNDGASAVDGVLSNVLSSGGLTKTGAGTLEVTGNSNTYALATTVSAGELRVMGSIATSSLTTVNGGTLSGTGTVGAVTLLSGVLAPGTSPGTLNSGNLLLSGGTFFVELASASLGDQMNVTGTAGLGANTELSLTLLGGYAPQVSDSWVLVNNDGNDAFSTGAFRFTNGGSPIQDNTPFVVGADTFLLQYNAGTGNDVVLTATVPEPTSALLLLGSGAMLLLSRRRAAV